MANYYPCLILQRIVLPLIIVACAVMRPVGIALAYLFMFFITPFIPIATSKNLKGPSGAYFIILIALSSILLVGHIGLQIAVLLSANLIGECTFTEILLRHIGFINLDSLNVAAVLEWIMPEIIMFLTSTIFYVVLRKLTADRPGEIAINPDGTTNNDRLEEGLIESRRKTEQLTQATIENIKKIGPFFSLLTLFFASAFRPSVPGGFYFLVFLSTATYWACFKPLKRGFALILRFTMSVLVVHVVAILSYQTPWPQDHIANSSLAARLTALEPLFISHCNKNGEDIRIIDFNSDVEFDSYLNPISMLLCYYVLALTSSVMLKKKEEKKRSGAFGQLENGNKLNRQVSLVKRPTKRLKPPEKWENSTQKFTVIPHRENTSEPPTERTPLVRRTSKRAQGTRSSVVVGERRVSAETAGNIPLDTLDEVSEDREPAPSIMDQVWWGIYAIGGFVYQNSYIFTNITMMVWSIIYHCWLTFALLIGANILWMIPNQRKTMLNSSPFIVLYAELLLLAQYIYGMNLNDSELPSTVNVKGINLAQIGFLKPARLPFIPLMVKTLFTTMFWITLRQLFKEAKEKRQYSTLADMVAPLQLTVGAATADLAPKSEPAKSSKFLQETGKIIKGLLVKMWIWLLIFVIFLCAITGKKMTGFRICYMALFLFFLLAFQLSWKAWTKIMYGFWIVLIAYAMTILILIYTYQFDEFGIYWLDYLGISVQLQGDIGLEKYETKDLFLHLVNPTALVIMTVIQVHYFHKRFLESLQAAVATDLTPVSNTTSANFGPTTPNPAGEKSTAETDARDEVLDDEVNAEEVTGKLGRLNSFRRKSKKQIGSLFYKIRHSSRDFIEFLWVFAEIHLIKFVYIIAFLTCVREVCVLHIVFVFLTVIALMSKTKAQIYISRLIAVIVSALLLTKMIYQVDYINDGNYNVTCEDNRTDVDPQRMNNAVWFGLHKLPQNEQNNLDVMLQGYIVYMVVLTFHAVIVFRQAHMRASHGIVNFRPHLVFPDVTRKDAEKNLFGCIQYLFNYGYYKFGVEISLIVLVSLISFRQDVVAILYAFWLCVLFVQKRQTCAKIWPAFQWFTAIIIPIQFLLFVGLPPGLCIVYPWHNSTFEEGLESWGMLPGPHLIEQSFKLMFDFILLMFVCRQSRVFSLEKRFEDNVTEFPGGTNKSITRQIDNLGVIPFDNPTPDFISNVRNWLDILKVAVLTGFFWFTLAVVFLAGTNTVSLFSIGYLIGSFVFLWQGTDFYLRPIAKILKWWYVLLAYNVSVITIKTTLQIAGCLFLSPLKKNVCWLVHFLGVSCIRDLQPIDSETEDPLECPSSKDATGLSWDAVCFAFLIFQLRIFSSYYFCHIINDTKASTILASRGAELIEDLRQKQIQYKTKYESEVLRKIKKKMEKIRATQQKMLRPIEKPTHFDEVARAPLARSSSMSSCHGSGYHTPIEVDQEDDNNDGEGGSEIPSDLAGLIPSTNTTGSTLQTQAPSPSSAVLTVSLEGYLEPQRLSISSPPNSDMLPRIGSDDSFPAFSPPPYDSQEDSKTLVPPSSASFIVSSTSTTGHSNSVLQVRQHRRQSSLNTVSWNEKTTTVSKGATILSGSPVENEEHTPVLRNRSMHRRQSSMGATASFINEESCIAGGNSRRYSNLSWAQHDDTISAKTYSQRPYSWGPIGDLYYIDSLMVEPSIAASHEEYTTDYRIIRREPSTRSEAIRAGDYYMFDDLDEKIELDLMDEESDFLEAQGEISASELKMSKRKTLLEVYQGIESERRKQMLQKDLEKRKLKRASSVPVQSSSYKIGSHQPPTSNRSSTILSDEEKLLARRSTLSEPLPVMISDAEFNEKDTEKTLEKDAKITEKQEPSTSRGIASSSGESKKKAEDTTDASELSKPDEEEVGLIPRLIEGFLVSLAVRLNRLSRNYRYVMKILANEKKLVKESEGFGVGARTGTGNIWTPFRFIKKPASSDADTSNTQTIDTNVHTNVSLHHPPSSSSATPHHQDQTHESHIAAGIDQDPEAEQKLMSLGQDPDSVPSTSRSIQIDHQDDVVDHRHKADRRRASILPEIRIMAPSLERGLDESAATLKHSSQNVKTSKEDIDEYEDDFTTRDHHILIEVLIALWYAILSNTDLVCYFVVFIKQVKSASILSLPLPLMVFLWGTLALPRPTKTFWVTLIAYTQAVVLIKCVFQFGVIRLNRQAYQNSPLSFTKLFEMEYRDNYAAYDLFLLLVLFFHRFVLKSQGLWKSDYREETIPDGNYILKDETHEDRESLSKETNEKAVAIRDNGAMVPSKGEEDGTGRPETASNIQVYVSSFIEEPGNYLPEVVKITSAKYCSSLVEFFKDLIQKSRLPTDVYALAFLCDFVNFFVLLFGFTAFGSQQGDGGVQTYLEENKVPIPFLIMLLIQFVLILVDRALYLRKALVYKIVFHFLLVIGVHVWMFFVIPAITETNFNASSPPVMYYVIKCIYLLLSSYQIRCGYPSRILGNFLTRAYSMINMVAFKIYMAIPFLFELRTFMDWVCTDTTMTLFDWLKMEDIFASIYFIKCSRQMETDLPSMRAQKKAALVKVLMGGTAVFLLIVLIWGPLALFALGNTVGESNIPFDVSLSLKIGPYEPIYEMSAQDSSIHPFTPQTQAAFYSAYHRNKSALSFLSNYDSSDVAAVVLGANSTSLWSISPPDKERLIENLRANNTLTCRLKYTVSRKSHDDKKNPGITNAETEYEMTPHAEGREALQQMLEGNKVDQAIVLPNLLPKFIKVEVNYAQVKSSGDLKSVPQLMPNGIEYRNLTIKLFTIKEPLESWWEIREQCDDEFYKNYLSRLPFTNCEENVVIYTFNDKLFPSSVTFLTAGGIIGVYTTFVVVAARVFRSFVSGSSRHIMFEDLPYVDRVLQLCLDIYLVREALEFSLEEDLFAKLLFLYRSPETMIKWTRPKEEHTDDETEETESVRSRASSRRRPE